MDQNQTVDNQTIDNQTTDTPAVGTQTTDTQTTDSSSVDNDLQKAIDNITNTTSVDPVFSDPVAAPSSVPEGDTGELGEPVGPFPAPEPEPKVETVEQSEEPIAPLESMNIPEINNFGESSQSLSTGEVKKAALRDLLPLLDKVQMNSSEKFRIYRDIFDDLKDYTVLDSAYQATRDISDETERANALLYLVKAIDNM